ARPGDARLAAANARIAHNSLGCCLTHVLIHVQVRAEFFQDLLALLVPHHQVDALAAVFAFEALLGLAEEREVALPVVVAAEAAALLQRRGAVLADALE